MQPTRLPPLAPSSRPGSTAGVVPGSREGGSGVRSHQQQGGSSSHSHESSSAHLPHGTPTNQQQRVTPGTPTGFSALKRARVTSADVRKVEVHVSSVQRRVLLAVEDAVVRSSPGRCLMKEKLEAHRARFSLDPLPSKTKIKGIKHTAAISPERPIPGVDYRNSPPLHGRDGGSPLQIPTLVGSPPRHPTRGGTADSGGAPQRRGTSPPGGGDGWGTVEIRPVPDSSFAPEPGATHGEYSDGGTSGASSPYEDLEGDSSRDRTMNRPTGVSQLRAEYAADDDDDDATTNATPLDEELELRAVQQLYNSTHARDSRESPYLLQGQCEELEEGEVLFEDWWLEQMQRIKCRPGAILPAINASRGGTPNSRPTSTASNQQASSIRLGSTGGSRRLKGGRRITIGEKALMSHPARLNTPQRKLCADPPNVPALLDLPARGDYLEDGEFDDEQAPPALDEGELVPHESLALTQELGGAVLGSQEQQAIHLTALQGILDEREGLEEKQEEQARSSAPPLNSSMVRKMSTSSATRQQLASSNVRGARGLTSGRPSLSGTRRMEWFCQRFLSWETNLLPALKLQCLPHHASSCSSTSAGDDSVEYRQTTAASIAALTSGAHPHHPMASTTTAIATIDLSVSSDHSTGTGGWTESQLLVLSAVANREQLRLGSIGQAGATLLLSATAPAHQREEEGDHSPMRSGLLEDSANSPAAPAVESGTSTNALGQHFLGSLSPAAAIQRGSGATSTTQSGLVRSPSRLKVEELQGQTNPTMSGASNLMGQQLLAFIH